MNTDTVLIKKYELLAAQLRDANAQQEKVISLQQEEIDGLRELLFQKEEKITLLTTELEKTVEAAKEMAKIMDSLFQD